MYEKCGQPRICCCCYSLHLSVIYYLITLDKLTAMFNNQLLNGKKIFVEMKRAHTVSDDHPSRLPEGLKGVGIGLGEEGKPSLKLSRKCWYCMMKIIVSELTNTEIYG